MPIPIATLLQGPKGYAYTTLPSPDPEDLCLICKEPYNTPDGCHPIKLTSCGHIIGHECFEEWIKRSPGICPYWSHHLPEVPLPSDSWTAAILIWITGTMWFRAVNYVMINVPFVGLNSWVHFFEYCFETSDPLIDCLAYPLAMMSLLNGHAISIEALRRGLLWGAASLKTDIPVCWTMAYQCVLKVASVLLYNAMGYMTVICCVYALLSWWEKKGSPARFRI